MENGEGEERKREIRKREDGIKRKKGKKTSERGGNGGKLRKG